MTKARQRERAKTRNSSRGKSTTKYKTAEEWFRGESIELRKFYGHAIEAAIAKVKISGSSETVIAEDGSPMRAYPHKDGVAWEINCPESEDGGTALSGIRTPDGKDIIEEWWT